MTTSESKTPTDAKNEKANEMSTSTTTPMSTKQPEAQEAIEEDDEFEEFQCANWGAGEEDAGDTQQWQDNWDVDDMDDDFTKNLRAELMANSQ